MDEKQAHDHYKDPSNLAPAGPGRRRKAAPPMTSHVPVRFPSDLIGIVRQLADRDQVSVSSWIRRTVQREIERTCPPQTEAVVPAVYVETTSPAHSVSSNRERVPA